MDKIRVLKALDKLLGIPLVWLLSLLPTSKKKINTPPKKILIIRPGGIGDAVLLLPAIEEIKKNIPGAQIDILCEKRNAGIFDLTNKITKIYLYDKWPDIVNCLKNKYDVTIDTEQWHRLSAVVAFLSGAPVRIGFATNTRGSLFTIKIPYRQDDYEAISFLSLAAPLTGKRPEFDAEKPFISVTDKTAEQLLAYVPENEKKNMIAVFPGASVVERRWGAKNFGAVARSFTGIGRYVILIGGKQDADEAKEIKNMAGNNCINLAGKTTLRETASILKQCKVLISADSGIMHLAYSLGVPTISLFGSGIEKKWAPRGKDHVVINKHLKCSPCTRFGYTPACQNAIACLKNVPVEEILKKLGKIMENERS